MLSWGQVHIITLNFCNAWLHSIILFTTTDTWLSLYCINIATKTINHTPSAWLPFHQFTFTLAHKSATKFTQPCFQLLIYTTLLAQFCVLSNGNFQLLLLRYIMLQTSFSYKIAATYHLLCLFLSGQIIFDLQVFMSSICYTDIKSAFLMDDIFFVELLQLQFALKTIVE